MRKLYPLALVLLLPGCTFFTNGSQGVNPRTTTEMKDFNPGLYIVLGVFILILLMSVGAALFKESQTKPGQPDDSKVCAMMLAVIATVVVAFLVG